jgi:Transmembrane secretion effector
MLNIDRRMLHDRTFRTVAGGEVLSVLGDYAYQVAFAWLVLSVTESAVTLAAVMICNVIPNGLLILVGGAVTDRWSPRRVMACSHLSQGLLVSGLCTLTLTGSVRLWQLYAMAAAFGLADAFFWPASGSIVPLLVASADLPAANAVIAAGEQVAMFAGPLLGAVVMTAFSPSAVLAVNAMTFFTAAVTILRAPTAVPPGQHQRWSARSLLSSITAGLSYARGAAGVRAVLVIVSASTLAYSGLFAVALPAFARASGHGPLALGALIACWGLGQLLGAISAGITGLPRRWGALIIGMTLCEGTAFAVIGAAASMQMACSLLAVLGAGVAYSSDVALPTWIHVSTPAQLLGRVNSLISLPRAVLPPVSLAVMGALAAAGARLPFYLASLLMALAGVIVALNPATRKLSMQNRATAPADLSHPP